MKRFKLMRKVDHTGVSGTGYVAQGVVFNDRSVVLKWHSGISSLVIYNDIADMLEIHNHEGTKNEGGTYIEWIDH
jgi:hypothetical protein